MIEWLTSFTRVRSIPAEGYQQYISELLEDLKQLWEHAFRNQISEAAKSAILCLYTVGDWRDQVDFEPEFLALHTARARKYNFKMSATDFRDALTELDGAFLTFSHGRVSFLNPSVKEYAAGVIASQVQTVEDLMVAAIRLRQLAELWKLSRARPQSDLSQLLMRNLAGFILRVNSLQAAPIYRWDTRPDGRPLAFIIDLSNADRLSFIAECCEREKRLEIIQNLASMTEHTLGEFKRSYIGVWSTIRLLIELSDLPWFLAHGGLAVRREITDCLLAAAKEAGAEDWVELHDAVSKLDYLTDADRATLAAFFQDYSTLGLKQELLDCTDIEEKKTLANALEALDGKVENKFTEMIQKLQQQIEEAEEDKDRLKSGAGDQPATARHSVQDDALTQDQVREMFQALISP